MPACPICHGRFDTWGGVSTHIWKKQDEDHDMADSKDEATIWLGENDHITRDTSIDMSDPDDTDTTTDTSADPKAEPLPDMPSEPEQKDPEPDDPEVTCPGCGSTEIADAQFVVKNQGDAFGPDHYQLLQSSDYVCAACGGVFDE